MDLETLRHGNFALLGNAIDDWSSVIKSLTTMEKDAREDLKGRADKANWAGVNATVSREFITKTAGEFADALTQATTIRDILRDTRGELIKYRDELNEAISRGRNKHHLQVLSTKGGGFTIRVNADPEPADSKQIVEALRNELQGILDKATNSDTTAAEVLRAIANRAEYGFSGASYKDRESAADALKKAKEMADIAKKDPEKLTAKDFDTLNAGLKKWGNDPLFSEEFATRLGPEGTLEFWTGITDARENPDLFQARHGKFDGLQKHLGLTLASATQSDSLEMQRWERNMINLGGEFIPKENPRAMGFQVMSNLMRWGDFDDRFLKNYGSELIRVEKDRTDNGSRPAGDAWLTPVGSLLNQTGSDSGIDPMTGFMKALANSPEAATDFFNDTFVTEDEDHEFLRDTDDQNDYKGKVSLSNFQYLFEEREWPKDYGDDGKESVTGKNALGHALEAATTGHPAGSKPAAADFMHSEEQATLFKDIVESVSVNPERLTHHGYLSDSLGKISGEYMPDINRALNADQLNVAKLYPVTGSAAHIEQSDAARFLHTVGRNPEGFDKVTMGQHAYTNALMEHHFKNPSEYITDPRFSDAENLKETIGAIAKNSGEIQGTLAAGRAFEVEESGSEKDAEFNKALENSQTWVSSAAGIGVGLVTAPYTGPGGTIAGGVAGTATDEILGSIVEGLQKDGRAETIYHNGADWDDTQKSTSLLVQEGAQRAGDLSGYESPHIVTTASGKAEDGFSAAAANVRTYVDGQGAPKE